VRGVITSRDVLKNLPLIWRGFGAKCTLRCLMVVLTGKRTTFLQVVYGDQRPIAVTE